MHFHDPACIQKVIYIESGDAITIGKRMEWTYQTTKEIPALAGMKLEATAVDRPGKEVTQEHVF